MCVDETDGSADVCQAAHKLELVYTYSMRVPAWFFSKCVCVPGCTVSFRRFSPPLVPQLQSAE